MDISYDLWVGESINEVIELIAGFRLQILAQSGITHALSEEINFLHQYFDDEAVIIVANDCGKFTGYLSMIGSVDNHPKLDQYSHFGADLAISEGPIVHPYYRNLSIEQSLMLEAINECQIRDKQMMIIQSNLPNNEPDQITDYQIQLDDLLTTIDFEKVDDHDDYHWVKSIGVA
tara:strand:- start:10 stop:534 length:525 start_codon:yes stop_codon:yes gene_type:complete